MLRISWKERITNHEVMRRVKSGRTMLKEIVKRMKFFGHVMEKEEPEFPISNVHRDTSSVDYITITYIYNNYQ